MINERAKPYIGITGFKRIGEINEATKTFERLNLQDKNHTAMYGFLITEYQFSNISKHNKRGPSLLELSKLLSIVPKWALPSIHYCPNSKDRIDEFVTTIFTLDNIYESNLCRTVQINTDWPDLNIIENIKNKFSDLQIVMQIPTQTSTNMTNQEIAQKASQYDSLISYALIDPSKGAGIDFKLNVGLDLMHKLSDKMPTTRIGIAGGLSGENVEEKINELKNNFDDNFFIDAEGKLMPEYPYADLNIDACNDYIVNSIKGFYS